MRMGQTISAADADSRVAPSHEARATSKFWRSQWVLACLWPAVLCLSLGCTATAGVKPVVSHSSETPCPAGRITWNLQISDQRATLEDSAHVVDLVRKSLSGSLPDCRWTSAPQPDAGTITIEIHRFAATSDQGVWDAGVEWGTWVRDAAGRTLTEFEATGEESRPSYRGEDSERVAIQRALEKAMGATLNGLRSLSPGS
jgi:hypothetical protein